MNHPAHSGCLHGLAFFVSPVFFSRSSSLFVQLREGQMRSKPRTKEKPSQLASISPILSWYSDSQERQVKVRVFKTHQTCLCCVFVKLLFDSFVRALLIFQRCFHCNNFCLFNLQPYNRSDLFDPRASAPAFETVHIPTLPSISVSTRTWILLFSSTRSA